MLNLPANRLARKGFLICLLMLYFTLRLESQQTLMYTQVPTITRVGELNQVIVEAFPDSLDGDTIYLVKSREKIPLYAFRNISTEVCFDHQCRRLSIKIYWNITGRYLGFKLPQGEYLSKYDHTPFDSLEYQKLNELLADPSLGLDRISFRQLISIPVGSPGDSVDGVSGATTLFAAERVVKGAAYTTYTLWNIVHGPSRDQVAGITESMLGPGLIQLILKSPVKRDRIWALDRIRPSTELTPELKTALMEMISGQEFNEAYSAIRAIHAPHLHSGEFQLALFSEYSGAAYSIKGLIIEKLKEAPFLEPEIIRTSSEMLDKLNGKQLGEFLEIYSAFSVDELEINRTLAGILLGDNRYIAGIAYRFLLTTLQRDAYVIECMENFQRKN